MSLEKQKQKCVVCSAYLFEEDDVVHCPVCGAPHHRECYLKVGNCGLYEYHGTEKEYRREEAEKATILDDMQKNETPAVEKCRGCGMPLDENSNFCGNCGMPSKMVNIPLDESPIDAGTPIADGVTAGEAAEIVRTNSFRYIPKFLKLNADNKKSWNWAAFLIPHGWFAFRKMYKESIIVTLILIATAVMNIPFAAAFTQLPTLDLATQNYLQLSQEYMQLINDVGFFPFLLSFVGTSLHIVVRIISAIHGDYIYKQRVVQNAALIKEAEDTEAAKAKYSGTSFIGFVLAVLALEFLPSIIALFL